MSEHLDSVLTVAHLADGSETRIGDIWRCKYGLNAGRASRLCCIFDANIGGFDFADGGPIKLYNFAHMERGGEDPWMYPKEAYVYEDQQDV